MGPARAFGLAPRSCGAVSSAPSVALRALAGRQKRFGFRQTNAPESNFQEFCRLIQPREARPISSGKFPKVKFWCVYSTKSEPILPARQSPKGDGGSGTDGALRAPN